MSMTPKMSGDIYIAVDVGVGETCVEWTIDKDGCIKVLDCYEVNK